MGGQKLMRNVPRYYSVYKTNGAVMLHHVLPEMFLYARSVD